MIFFGMVIGVVILIGMIYMALNKNSDFVTRVASLVSLAVMIIAIIICLSLILLSGKAPPDPSVVIVGQVDDVGPVAEDNSMKLLLLVIFLAVLFVLTAVISMRDHRKKNGVNAGSRA